MSDYTYGVIHGGLMRCCIQSIDDWEVEHKAESEADPDKEVTIGYRFHKDPEEPVAVRREGVWRWVGAQGGQYGMG